MSEHSAEADRIDEAVLGGSESSIESDIAASGTDGGDAGVGANAGGAEDGVTDSHAADVAAGFDDSDDAPVQPSTEEDGTL
jgi:hypothetical protein